MRAIDFISVLMLSSFVSPLVGEVRQELPDRSASWATPISMKGAPNLFKVTDHLYRSAQPNAKGMRNLEKFGIKHVINLRHVGSDTNELKGTQLQGTNVDMNTWHIESEDVVKVLRLVNDPAGGPYLIHCKHGADRTGTVVAMFRMVIQGWPREEAIKEMIDGGYGYHAMWKNILTYLKSVDVGQIRGEVFAELKP